MRVVYACLDPFLSENGVAAADYAAMAAALEGAGHEVIALGMGGAGRVPGVSRTVRLQPSAAGKLVADHVAGSEWEGLAAGIEAFWNNDKLIRALRIEHQRAPLDAVVERMSPYTFGMQALCSKLEIAHVYEVRPPAAWDTWPALDLEMQRIAHAVHLFAARRTDMIFTTEDLAPEYRDITPVPVRTLADRSQPPRRARRHNRHFTIGVAGPLNQLADLPLLRAAADHLPRDVVLQIAEEGLGGVDAGVILPASRPDGHAARLSRCVAARIPVVVSAGSLGDRLLPPSLKVAYKVDDPRSLAYAMTLVSRLERPPEPEPLPTAWDIDAEVIAEGIRHLGRGSR